MSEEELIETLRAFEKNRVEQLEEPARNLFYAIMKIADERDRLNNIIKEAKEYIETNWINQKDADIHRFDTEELEIEISDIAVLYDLLEKGE